MSARTTSLYRSVLRELRKSAVSPRQQRSRAVNASLRTLLSSQRSPEQIDTDVRNALTFLESQRTYKELLLRYNPLQDITSEERVKASARRVGLDMPVESERERS